MLPAAVAGMGTLSIRLSMFSLMIVVDAVVVKNELVTLNVTTLQGHFTKPQNIRVQRRVRDLTEGNARRP